MLRHRIHPWNCSKFADLIRGSVKPAGLTLEGWKEWKIEQKTKHPVRYWFAEKGLIKLQNFLMFPLDIYGEAKYYIYNRWIDKTHYLQTGLKPGHYYEFDYRILHGIFNELVIYVEVELAHTMKAYPERKYKFVNGRCAKAGLDHLEWACDLKYTKDWGVDKKDPKYGKPTQQAITAKKIKELYLWWKDRPNRPEPMEVAKLTWDQDKEDNLMNGKITRKELSEFKKLEKIEADYEKEDTKMLIELIKIRKELWS
jgi:hypothetical protein